MQQASPHTVLNLHFCPIMPFLAGTSAPVQAALTAGLPKTRTFRRPPPHFGCSRCTVAVIFLLSRRKEPDTLDQSVLSSVKSVKQCCIASGPHITFLPRRCSRRSPPVRMAGCRRPPRCCHRPGLGRPPGHTASGCRRRGRQRQWSHQMIPLSAAPEAPAPCQSHAAAAASLWGAAISEGARQWIGGGGCGWESCCRPGPGGRQAYDPCFAPQQPATRQ